jgi:hypothetical protein
MSAIAAPVSRRWLYLQLAIAWLPMWALFTTMIVIAHGYPWTDAAIGGLRMVVPGALLGFGVYRFAVHTPWPHPFRSAFIGQHVLAAIGYSLGWYLLISLTDSVVRGHWSFGSGPGFGLYMLTGLWLYLIVAGVAYANLAAKRSARLEAEAARMQLEALRAQLQPHFLFNALHTVVQLIPQDPAAAVHAAEELGAALRSVLELKSDRIALAQEWAFVERYLALEQLRFGSRLAVDVALDPAARAAFVPAFALQTLVENAVRHGAAPRVETTTLRIAATCSTNRLELRVDDDGVGADADALNAGGTGLARLRERLRGLYGSAATLTFDTAPSAGCRARLSLPLDSDSADD